jgi:hypothetical protein
MMVEVWSGPSGSWQISPPTYFSFNFPSSKYGPSPTSPMLLNLKHSKAQCSNRTATVNTGMLNKLLGMHNSVSKKYFNENGNKIINDMFIYEWIFVGENKIYVTCTWNCKNM